MVPQEIIGGHFESRKERKASCDSWNTRALFDSEIDVPLIPKTILFSLEENTSETDISPRKTIIANNSFVAWLSRDIPGIKLSSYDGKCSCHITQFNSWIVDFCFASPALNIIVSVEKHSNLRIHRIAEQGSSIVASALGQLAFQESTSLWSVSLATLSHEKMENIGSGYLIVGSDGHLTAVQVASVITIGESVDLCDVPRVNYGDCQRLYAVCSEGRRLAVSNDSAVSVYLLPSPAAHTSWVPHEGQELAGLTFGHVSSMIISFSDEGGSIFIWDINDIEPVLQHAICLSSRCYRSISDTNYERIFLCSFGSPSFLVLDTAQLWIKEYAIDEKIEPCTYYGWCVIPAKKHYGCIVRSDNSIWCYVLPEKTDSAVHQDEAAEENGEDLDIQILSKTSNENSCTSLNYLSDEFDHGERHDVIEEIGATPQSSEGPQENWRDGLHSNESLNSVEKKENEAQDSVFEVLSHLQESIDRVTQSIIQITQRVSSYHESVNHLESRVESLPLSCNRFMKNHLKERADGCITSLEPTFQALSLEPKLVTDNKTIQARFSPMLAQLLNDGIQLYEEKATQCSMQPNKIFDVELQALIRKIFKQSFPSVELGEHADQLDRLGKEVLFAQSNKNLILGRLQLEQYEEALELALQADSSDSLVWLLTEASSMQTWSELIVDEKLSPLITLSLAYNTCVALSLGSCVYPASTSEKLILLVRDTVVMYKKRWSEAYHGQVYNAIRDYCFNLIRSIQKDNSRGPLYSYINETLRVLQT